MLSIEVGISVIYHNAQYLYAELQFQFSLLHFSDTHFSLSIVNVDTIGIVEEFEKQTKIWDGDDHDDAHLECNIRRRQRWF